MIAMTETISAAAVYIIPRAERQVSLGYRGNTTHIRHQCEVSFSGSQIFYPLFQVSVVFRYPVNKVRSIIITDQL